MLSYLSESVSIRALNLLAETLRRHRNQIRSRWRKLNAGDQALLMLAHFRKGDNCLDLACGFRIGTSTVYRYLREAIALLTAMAPKLGEAIETDGGKVFVILDGTLLRIDRIGMASGYDWAFYSGKHKCHGVNVQVIADPAGRLMWLTGVARRSSPHGCRVRTRNPRRVRRGQGARPRRHRLPGHRHDHGHTTAASTS